MGQVKSGWVDLYFSHEFFFLSFNEKNMYLPFGKLCNKLLDVKCIILNSLLVSRMNSVKFINTYCERNKSFPNQVLSSLEMALSLSPQGFAQSHIGERLLPLMPWGLRLNVISKEDNTWLGKDSFLLHLSNNFNVIQILILLSKTK